MNLTGATLVCVVVKYAFLHVFYRFGV